MEVWIGLFACLLLLIGLYLFLIAPNVLRRKKDIRPLRAVWYAHRGLHGAGIPENSLAAFRSAAEKGYGIELDVRPSRDGQLIIHHDPSAMRTCGVDSLIADMTLTDIQSLRLSGTDQSPPTLPEALSLIGGRVPLIVEIKPDQPLGVSLAEKVYACMRTYAGPWWVESFDPRIVRWFRRRAPDVIRGQLAFDPAGLGLKRSFLTALGAHMMMNVLSRPDFVAYSCRCRGNVSFRIMRRLYRPVLAAWTVKTPEESQDLRTAFDVQIFEGFEP